MLEFLRRFWRQIFIIAVPLVFIPLPLFFNGPEYVVEDGHKITTGVKEARCAFVVLLMGTFWLSEVVPMAIVSLMPAILFPLLGIQGSKDVCPNYFKDTVMLFVGSLIVAVAVEESNLHKRIALRVLLLVGSKPRWLMFGFMMISAFLSMWMSNTATTAMITPIAETVILELFKRKRALNAVQTVSIPDHTKVGTGTTRSFANSALSLNPLLLNDDSKSENHRNSVRADSPQPPAYTDPSVSLGIKDLTPDELHVAKGLILCVAYAANIGGTATLTGTLPNVVLKGQIDVLIPGCGLNFATFLLFAFPGMLVTLIVAWAWLQWIFVARCSCKKGSKTTDDTAEDHSSEIKQIIRDKYRELGPMGFGEFSVLMLFILLIVSWVFRSPQFVPGWKVWFKKGYVTDATPVILVSLLLFIWPRQLFGLSESKKGCVPTVLTWDSMKRRFPWDVFLLLGGAIALAEGIEASGLTLLMESYLKALEFLPAWALILIISLAIAAVTEFASNGAIATIFLPVLYSLAQTANINPLYVMIPATIACSFAFMFPMATPPNAIAFRCGFIKVWDMIKAGAMLNLIAIILLMVNMHTMGIIVFDVLNTFPDWWHNNRTVDPTTKLSSFTNLTAAVSDLAVSNLTLLQPIP